MSDYNQIYKNDKIVWGREPEALIKKALNFLEKGATGLDLGCGQGKDSLFLAKKGFKITAIDLSKEAIEQIQAKIKKNKKLHIETICKNINDYKIEENKYDFIIGIDIFQFLTDKKIVNLIKDIKNKLKNNGLIIISSFTIKDPSYKKSNKKNIKYYFKPKEITNYFKDFEIIYYFEGIIKDSGHAGFPRLHKHGVVQIIARKIKS